MRVLRNQWYARIVVAVGIAATTMMTGCGDGNADETGASATLTKKEFLKKGNALCDKVLEERDILAAEVYEQFISEGGYKSSSKASRDQMAKKLAGETVVMYKNLVHGLEELGPPANDAEQVKKIMSEYEAILDQIGNDPKKLKEAEPLSPNGKAYSYGLISCGL
jgi:hypothetical protein